MAMLHNRLSGSSSSENRTQSYCDQQQEEGGGGGRNDQLLRGYKKSSSHGTQWINSFGDNNRSTFCEDSNQINALKGNTRSTLQYATDQSSLLARRDRTFDTNITVNYWNSMIDSSEKFFFKELYHIPAESGIMVTNTPTQIGAVERECIISPITRLIRGLRDVQQSLFPLWGGCE